MPHFTCYPCPRFVCYPCVRFIPSLVRRLLNFLIRTFGTNINRSFEPMISDLPVRTVKDERVMFSGAYRAIILERTPIPMSRRSHSLPKKT